MGSVSKVAQKDAWGAPNVLTLPISHWLMYTTFLFYMGNNRPQFQYQPLWTFRCLDIYFGTAHSCAQ